MIKKLLFLIPFLAFFLPLSAQAACGSGYTYCRTMTVNHAKVPNTDQTNFTVLATTTDATLATVANGGHVQNTVSFNGQTVPADMIFSTASDCSAAMSWDFASYSATTGKIEVWVLNSTVSHSSDTVFYMCYGKSSVSTYQGGSVGAAWDSNYIGIWHLPDGATLSANDSTSNGNNGNISTPTATTGQIDGGASFNGTTDKITVTGVLGSPSTVTMEGWINKTSGAGTPGGIMALGNSGGTGGAEGRVYIRADWNVNLGFRAGYYAGGQANDIFNNTSIGGTGWHHFVFVVNPGASSQILYIDGASAGTATNNTSIDYSGSPGDTTFGKTQSFILAGTLDEIRISKSARSADWVATEYNNQIAVNSFLTIGAEQSATVSSVSAILNWIEQWWFI